MELEEKIEKDVVLLSLEGKLMGGAETAILSDQLQQLIVKGYNKVVLDCEEVKWINSPGIGALIKWLMILRQNGGDLRLTNAKDKVEQYLKITKLMTVIKTFENPQDAYPGEPKSPRIRRHFID